MTLRRPALVSASCEVHRVHGPKGVHGGVSLEFERAEDFSFSAKVSWPAADNYNGAIERSVQRALREVRPQQNFSCRLTAITWHEIDSCASGFAIAARQATLAAFGGDE